MRLFNFLADVASPIDVFSSNTIFIGLYAFILLLISVVIPGIVAICVVSSIKKKRRKAREAAEAEAAKNLPDGEQN